MLEIPIIFGVLGRLRLSWKVSIGRTLWQSTMKVGTCGMMSFYRSRVLDLQDMDSTRLETTFRNTGCRLERDKCRLSSSTEWRIFNQIVCFPKSARWKIKGKDCQGLNHFKWQMMRDEDKKTRIWATHWMKDSKISSTNTVMQTILAEISNSVGYPHFSQTHQILMKISAPISNVITSRCSLKIAFNQFSLGTPSKLWAQLAREEQTLLIPCWRPNCNKTWTFRGHKMWDRLRNFRLNVTTDRGPTW